MSEETKYKMPPIYVITIENPETKKKAYCYFSSLDKLLSGDFFTAKLLSKNGERFSFKDLILEQLDEKID